MKLVNLKVIFLAFSAFLIKPVFPTVSGRVHPYILQHYQRATDDTGAIRSDANPDDIAIWGFLDNYQGGTYLCLHIN